MVTVTMCVTGELWLYGWSNFGNVQVRLVLAASARQCVDIQIETQRILKLFIMSVEMPIYAGKICDMCTSLKHVKTAAICEIRSNRIFV